MKNKNKKSYILLLLGLVFCSAQAQQASLATGGLASGSGGSVTYSIGQLAYVTDTGSSGNSCQGVQQAFEITTLGNDNYTGIQLMMVYPNPTTEFVKLQIADIAIENLSYQLFDIQGKEIINNAISNSETQINLQSYPQGAYIMKVSNNNKLLKTFKIIKN